MKPPSPPGHWLLGHLPERRRDALGLFTHGARDHGPIVRYRMGLFDSYLLTDPAFIRHVLQDNPGAYRKGPIFQKLETLIGKGLATSEGEHWRRQRRLVQPVFQQKRIGELWPLIGEILEGRLAAWERAGDTPIDIAAEMVTLTMDIICVSLFGRRALTRIAEISRAGLGFMDEVSEEVLRVFTPLGLLLNRKPKPGPAIVRLRQIIHGLIEERRGHETDEDFDFLSLLIAARDESGRAMTEADLRDEVMTLFVAGHETTAMALAWTFLLLGQNPEVQETLRASAQSLDSAIAWDAISRLPYPRMVVEEAMRLYPPIWSFPRRAAEDDTIGGYQIPRGTFVVLSAYVMQRHPAYWPDPDAFRPERFSADEAKTQTKFTYFPFGAAMRHCAGSNFAMIEMQTILATFFRHFTLSLVPGQTIAPLPLTTLKPSAPIMVRLKRVA